MVTLEIGLENGTRKSAQVHKLSLAFHEAVTLLRYQTGVPLAIYNDGRQVWSLNEESQDLKQVIGNLGRYYNECVRLEKRHEN